MEFERASLLLEKVALQHSMSREAGEVVGYRRESKPSALSPYKDKGTVALKRKELQDRLATSLHAEKRCQGVGVRSTKPTSAAMPVSNCRSPGGGKHRLIVTMGLRTVVADGTGWLPGKLGYKITKAISCNPTREKQVERTEVQTTTFDDE